MQELTGKQAAIVALALAAAMFFTRCVYFELSTVCANATMAVMFLGGIYLRRRAWLAGFLLLAAGIDATSIALGWIPASLITRASIFEPIAYAALWYVGCRSAMHGLSRVALIGVALLATVAAFALTNGSFYFLSGFFPATSVSGWLANYAHWAPLFVGTTVAYVGAVLLAHEAWQRLNRVRLAQRAH
ncbi:MAG TPA: hypothetical protein VFN09_12375 [Rhodanobacteraceae bacterium]|nr:hypothetical protein [Rhodanobacteraceae bacterium]